MTPIEIMLFLIIVSAATGAAGTGAWTALGKGPRATANRAALRAAADAGFSAAAGTARKRYTARRLRRSARQAQWRAWWNDTLSWGWFKPGPWLNSLTDGVQGVIRDTGAVAWSGARAGWRAGRTARRETLASRRGDPPVQPAAPEPDTRQNPPVHPEVCTFCHTDLVDAMCPRCTEGAIRRARDPSVDWDAVRADTAETRRRNDIEIARRRGLYAVDGGDQSSVPPAWTPEGDPYELERAENAWSVENKRCRYVVTQQLWGPGRRMCGRPATVVVQHSSPGITDLAFCSEHFRKVHPNADLDPDSPPPADETKENPMAAVANIEIMTVDDLEQILKAIRDAAVTLSETNFTEMAAAARRLPEDVQAAPFDPGDVVNRAISDLAEAAPDPKTFESMFEAADAAMQALKVLDGLREDASDVPGVQGELAAFAAS